MENMLKKSINLVSADMGYGHQRAAYPLLYLAGGESITINKYKGIPAWEEKYWRKSLESYEKISRIKKVPLLGDAIFGVMDYFQKIDDFYPYRDLSDQTIQQKYFLKIIEKGLGKDLISKLDAKLPFVTTFFVAAQMAEYHGYPGDIYCVICDNDASRAWAPFYPINSRIKYLVPSEKVRKRMSMYGVRENNIFISGFPLPLENVGSAEKQEKLKADLTERILRLDPLGKYRSSYSALLKKYLPDLKKEKTEKPLRLAFAVGGAGAQKEIGVKIMEKLSAGIKSGKYHLTLVAGSRPEIKIYFEKEARRVGLSKAGSLKILYAPQKNDYFSLFNKELRNIDILWTKPSELSFYAALGVPVMMSETVGSQEDFNREWLLRVGAGVDAPDAEFVDEWLPDMLSSGFLARAAMDGFLNAEAKGVYNIEKIVLGKK